MAQILTASMSHIDNLREQFTEQTAGMQSNQEKLSEIVQELAAMWEGTAHDAFHSALQAEVDNLGELLKRAKAINEFEELCVSEYDSADADVEQVVASGLK